MLQEENGKLTSELDAALAKLKESEENVFDLQQAIEVHTYSVMYNDYKHAYMIYAGLFYCVTLHILTDCHYSSLIYALNFITLHTYSCYGLHVYSTWPSCVISLCRVKLKSKKLCFQELRKSKDWSIH